MKLYYMPGACSLAVHIALIEAGVDFTPVRVDMATNKFEDGTDSTPSTRKARCRFWNSTMASG